MSNPSQNVTPTTTAIRSKTAIQLTTGLLVAGGLGLAAAIFFYSLDPANRNGSTYTVPAGQPLNVAALVEGQVVMNGSATFRSLQYLSGRTKIGQQTHVNTVVPEAVNRNNEGLRITLLQTSSNTNSTNSPATPFSIEPLKGATPFSIGGVWPTWLVKTAFAQATTFSIESIGGATPFSIEPIPSTNVPSQMIRFTYRLAQGNTPRSLIICVGPNSATTLYVGSDGSTYTNRQLTHRTTKASCPSITARALQFNDLSNLTAKPDRWNFGSIYAVHQDILGQVWSAGLDATTFADGQKIEYPVGPLSTIATRNAADPLSGTIPQLTLTLTGTSAGRTVAKQVCYPRTALPEPNVEGTHLQYYYYDTAGNVFSDIFLSQRITCIIPTGGGGPSKLPEPATTLE